MSKAGKSLMLQRLFEPECVPALVDLGYVNDKETRDCADALRHAGVGRQNFSIEGFGRLMVSLPAKKAASLLAQFKREILPGETYWQSTHHRRGLNRTDTIPNPGGSADGK